MVSVDWSLPGFTELARLGEGGFGRVVLARRDGSGEVVAIKYLFADGERTQFRHEAAILRRVLSPFVARMYQFAESSEGAAIVMEAVPGVSLRAVLNETPILSPESALVLLKGSLLGLAAAHAVGTVHRDYKPGNVIVQPNQQSKLVDFGIALLTGHSGHTGGTPAYMAPEQWQGAPATPATDVYAATCVFFQCVAGGRPFEASTTDELRVLHRYAPPPVERAPEAVRGLVWRGMAKSTADRPTNAAAFAAELEAAAVAGYGRWWETTGWTRLAELAGVLLAASPMAWVISATGVLGPATGVLLGGAAGGGAGAVGGGLATNAAAGGAGTAVGGSAAGGVGAAAGGASGAAAGGIGSGAAAGGAAAGTGAAGGGAAAGSGTVGAAGGGVGTGAGAAGGAGAVGGGLATNAAAGGAGTAVGGSAAGGVGAAAGGTGGAAAGSAVSGGGAAGGGTAGAAAGSAVSGGGAAGGTGGAAASGVVSGGGAVGAGAGGAGAAGGVGVGGVGAGGVAAGGVGAVGLGGGGVGAAAAGVVAAKIAAVVIAVAVVVGVAVIVTNAVEDDVGVGVDSRLSVDVETLRASYDVNLDVTADVVQVSGHPDRDVEERIDQALLAPVNGEITELRDGVDALRELLAGEERADDPVTTTISATVPLQNERFVSVRYENQPVSDLITNSSWQSFATATVDLRSGEAVTKIFRGAVEDGMDALAPLLVEHSGDGLCGAGALELSGDDLGENVLVAFADDHVEFTVVLPLLGQANACGIPTVDIPYDELGDLLDPALVAGVTGG